jgi:phosphate transport system protein
MQLAIEDQCVTIIASQQPVARDLRKIMTSIKVVSNVERIGDHALHLGKITKRMVGHAYHSYVATMKSMAETGIAMLHDAMTAYVACDGAKARDVARRDDEIDAMRDILLKEILTNLHQDEKQIDDAVSLIFTARFLERLGDHVVNVCEWIVYAADGVHVELNT